MEQTHNSGKTNEPAANFLPKGWKREEVMRKSGLACGKVDIVYHRYENKWIGLKFHKRP